MAVNFRTGVDWQDVRVFSALARLGTLSATARALGVNHATVARRIARLEGALGVALFHRRPEGYLLSEAAAPLLESVQRMEDAAEGLARREAAPLSGTVRLTATASLIDVFLLPWLAPFLAAHPGIDLHLVADARALSLARHETDLAIRMARPEDGSIVARPLASVTYGVYAAPSWAARIAVGEPPEFVGFDEANASVPEAVWLARTFPQARLRLRTGTHFSQAEACMAGAGLAVLPVYVAARRPGLRPVELGPAPPPRALWLLSRQDIRTTPRLRATAGFLADLFERNRAAFETGAPPAGHA